MKVSLDQKERRNRLSLWKYKFLYLRNKEGVSHQRIGNIVSLQKLALIIEDIKELLGFICHSYLFPIYYNNVAYLQMGKLNMPLRNLFNRRSFISFPVMSKY